jgi:hypothetical protein
MSREARKITAERPIVDQTALLGVYRESAEKARITYELLMGQAAMQELLVNARELKEKMPDVTRNGVEGLYDGRAAVLDIVDCFIDNTYDSRGVDVRDHVRVVVSAVAKDGNGELLCDLAMTRPRDSESLEAQVGDYHTKATRRGGNPGISWRTASGLVSGDDHQPMGLAPEVQKVMGMVAGILESQAKEVSL